MRVLISLLDDVQERFLLPSRIISDLRQWVGLHAALRPDAARTSTSTTHAAYRYTHAVAHTLAHTRSHTRAFTVCCSQDGCGLELITRQETTWSSETLGPLCWDWDGAEGWGRGGVARAPSWRRMRKDRGAHTGVWWHGLGTHPLLHSACISWWSWGGRQGNSQATGSAHPSPHTCCGKTQGQC